MTSCEVRPATTADILRWYEGPPPFSCKAFVMEVDGNLEALWGLRFVNGEAACFSMLTTVAREQKRAVVQGIRLLRKMLQEHQDVIAYADRNEPTAKAFLEHVGFKRIGATIWGEEVYRYE
jgi:hypothetical protein